MEQLLHKIPKEFTELFLKNKKYGIFWRTISPLAKNEWICWVTSAKKEETKKRRLDIMKDKLIKGEKRPCCWAGCPHRK